MGTETKPEFQALKEAIVECDEDGAKEAAEAIVGRGTEDAALVLRSVLPAASREVGDRFESGEYFIPHLVMAGDIMAAVTEVLERGIPQERRRAGAKVLIGTVEGDVHTIGKNIVSAMLRSSGFEVIDVGVDVKASDFVEKALEVGAEVIALSSLMTTTMTRQREVVEILKERGLRGRFKVMVGGGPVTQEWADKMEADGFGDDAIQAVRVARRLVGLED